MLAHPGLDVVCVCTPSGAHQDPAVKAAQAGKHVVVEKPLEITLERCDAIIQACDKAGVRLCTIFPSRFTPANLDLKAAIDTGRFGRLTLGDTYVKWWRTQEYYDSGGWRGTWDLDGGGALMNQAIHNVDLLYWLMGDVDSIQAMTATLAHERIEVEDTAVACLRFQNGALGVIEAATSAYPGLLKRTEIHGDRGSARVEQDDITLWDFQEKVPSDDEILAAMAGRAELQGRRQRPERHHAHRPPRPADRLPPGDRRGTSALGRWPRGAEVGRDHPGDLQVRPHGTGGFSAADRRYDLNDGHKRTPRQVKGVTSMKRSRNQTLDYLTYLAVRLVVGVAQALSIEQSYAFADSLAGLLYRVDKRHRRVAMENLRLAFGDRYNEAERDRIVRGVYRHFCRMLMEMLHIPRKLHPTTWRERITLVGHERGAGPAPSGRPAHHGHGPLRQLGDGRLPVRPLRLPAELRRPHAG